MTKHGITESRLASGNPSDQQKERQQLHIPAPRPSPLSVNKDSQKIKKPPRHLASQPHRDQALPYTAREPVLIYAVSPKVVHTTASDLMNVVQRLSSCNCVSPAARLAATENASLRGETEPARDETDEMEEAAELEACAPGILSPSPAMLLTVSSEMFSSAGLMSHVPSTIDLETLEVLNLSGCSKLDNFPEISPNVKELYIGGTMIQEIPSSIKNLLLLEKLDLENNRHLVNLPTSICKLKHLETLNLSGCSSFEQFPDLSRKIKCLKSLDLSRTSIKELPSSISYLTALEELRFVGCNSLVRLPDNAWSLRFKVEFRQIDTEKFSKLWNRFGWLKKVEKFQIL